MDRSNFVTLPKQKKCIYVLVYRTDSNINIDSD